MDYYDTTTYSAGGPGGRQLLLLRGPRGARARRARRRPGPRPGRRPRGRAAGRSGATAGRQRARRHDGADLPGAEHRQRRAAESVAVVGGPTPGINTVIEPGTQILPNVATIGGPTPGFDTVIEPGSPILPNVATIGGPTPGIAPLTESSGQILPNVAVVGKPTYGAFGALLDSGNPQLASTAAALIANQQGQADIMFRPSASELQLMRHLGYR